MTANTHVSATSKKMVTATNADPYRAERLALSAGSSALFSAVMTVATLTYGSTIGASFTFAAVVAMVLFLFALAFIAQAVWTIWNDRI